MHYISICRVSCINDAVIITGSRRLVLMRSGHLQGSSHCSLSAELLSRLGLITTPCWTEERLRQVQPQLTEALLFYW